MRPSPSAAARLRSWRAERSLSLAKAAKQLGVSAPTWYDWEKDEKRPRSAHRNAIELLTGIPAADWDTPEEREHIERVRELIDAVAIDPPPAPGPVKTRAAKTKRKPAVKPTPRRKAA